MQRQLPWLIFIAFVVLTVITVGLYFLLAPTPDPEPDPCSECIIDKAFDAEEHLNAAAFKKSLDSKIEAEVELKVSNQVTTELSSGHSLGVSEGQVTRTYNTILAGNTTTTQHANLYRAVACAFDKLYCRSEVLSAIEKDEKREGVLRDYAVEIYALLDQDNPLLAAGPTEETIPEEPVPEEIDPEENFPEDPITEEPTIDEPPPPQDDLGPEVRRPRVNSPVVVRANEPQPRVIRPARINSYLTGTQVYDVVLFAPKDASAAIVGGLIEQLRSTGLTVGRNVFTEDFTTRFKRPMAAGNWSFLPQLQLAERVHCLCRVVPGKLTVQPNFRLGRVFTTVRGQVTLELIDVSTGTVLAHETIAATGRGEKVDRAAAEADFLTAVLADEKFRGMGFGRCGGR